MKLSTLFSVLTAAGLAFGQTATFNKTSPGRLPVWTEGPLDMNLVYPLRVYLGATNGPKSGADFSLCPTDNGRMKTPTAIDVAWGDLNVYLIYYSTGGSGTFTAKQKALIENYIKNIGTTNYWKVVQKYKHNNVSYGKPILKQIMNVDCTKPMSAGGLAHENKCALTTDILYKKGWYYRTDDQAGLIQEWVANGHLPKDKNGLYLILLGSEATYTQVVFMLCNISSVIYTDKSTRPATVETYSYGSSALCGTHQITAPKDDGNPIPFYLQYAFLKMPSADSNCNIFPYKGKTPNADEPLDNLINLITHELVEGAVATFADDGPLYQDHCKLQPSDKCSNFYTHLTPFGSRYFNLMVNNQRYAVQPVWDPVLNKCSMGI